MEIMEKAQDIVRDVRESVTDYFMEDTLTSRKNLLTMGTICLMIGMIAGFIFSPIKKGIYFNISNNGNCVPQNKDKENNCCKEKKKGRK